MFNKSLTFLMQENEKTLWTVSSEGRFLVKRQLQQLPDLGLQVKSMEQECGYDALSKGLRLELYEFDTSV